MDLLTHGLELAKQAGLIESYELLVGGKALVKTNGAREFRLHAPGLTNATSIVFAIDDALTTTVGDA